MPTRLVRPVVGLAALVVLGDRQARPDHGAGRPEAFAPTVASGRVSDMELVHGQPIVGGTFEKRMLSYATRPEVFRLGVALDGQQLVAVDNATSVDAQGNVAGRRVFPWSSRRARRVAARIQAVEQAERPLDAIERSTSVTARSVADH